MQTRYNPDQYSPVVQPAADAVPEERGLYIAKVYGVFFTGVLAFFAFMAVPLLGAIMEISFFVSYVNAALQIGFWPSLLIILGSTFLASWVADKPGINVIGFYGLALAWGFLTIPLVLYAIAAAGGGLEIVFQAAGLTTLVMGALTAYVFITKKDFSFIGGFLFTGLILGIGAAILFWFMGSVLGMDTQVFSFALSAFFVLLFSGYVLYDTSRILHHYPTTAVIPAAMALMIDFIILFRSILYLLASRR